VKYGDLTAFELVAEARRIAPPRKPGVSHTFAFEMAGLSLADLNELVNELANRLETIAGAFEING
jgi:hypothetical protein